MLKIEIEKKKILCLSHKMKALNPRIGLPLKKKKKKTLLYDNYSWVKLFIYVLERKSSPNNDIIFVPLIKAE